MLENNIKYYARQKWHGTVPVGNMDTKSSEGAYGAGQIPPKCGGGRANLIYC